MISREIFKKTDGIIIHFLLIKVRFIAKKRLSQAIMARIRTLASKNKQNKNNNEKIMK